MRQIRIVGHCTKQLVWTLKKYQCCGRQKGESEYSERHTGCCALGGAGIKGIIETVGQVRMWIKYKIILCRGLIPWE